VSGASVDYWNRYEEDHDLMAKLGCQLFRLGIEWSKIEPEDGRFDLKAIEHYKKILQSLRNHKIKICLTIYHWVLPLWFAEGGGWLRPDAVDRFMKYSEVVVKEFGGYPGYLGHAERAERAVGGRLSRGGISAGKEIAETFRAGYEKVFAVSRALLSDDPQQCEIRAGRLCDEGRHRNGLPVDRRLRQPRTARFVRDLMANIFNEQQLPRVGQSGDQRKAPRMFGAAADIPD